MQGWTLSYEVYFYLVFSIVLLLSSERFAPWLLILWCGLTIALALSGLASPDAALGLLRSPLTLEFLAGCLLFQFYRRSRLHPTAGTALVALSLVWLALIIVWTNHHHGDAHWIESHLWARTSLFGSFAVLFLLGTLELERTGLVRYSRAFIAIGDWSYSIYLSHLIVLELIGRAFYRFAPHVPFAILMVAAISIPSSLLVGYVSYTFVERPLTAFLYKPTRRPVRLPQALSN